MVNASTKRENWEKPIFSILLHNKKIYILWFISYLLGTLFLIISGLLLSNIFAQYNDKKNNLIWFYIVTFLITLCVRIFVIFWNSLNEGVGRFTASNTIRSNYVLDLINKPGAHKTDKSSGDAINCFREDANQIENYISNFYIYFLSTIIFSIIALIILIITNWKLVLISFTPLIVFSLFINKISERITKYRTINRKITGKVSTVLGDIFQNFQAIKLSCAEDSMISYLQNVNKERKQAAIIDNALGELLNIVSSSTINIGISLILFFIVFFFGNNMFSLGEFTLFTYYMRFISIAITYTTSAFIEQKRVKVAFNSIKSVSKYIDISHLGDNNLILREDLIDTYKKEEFKNIDIGNELFSVRNLNGYFGDSQKVIKDISFSIKKGTITVITGRIGSGKTTLIRSILGLLENDGHVIWKNNKYRNLKYCIEHSEVAYSPQTPHFFSASIQENIVLGRENAKENIYKAVEAAALKEDIENMSLKYEQLIGNNGIKLSGGQQKRLSIARMLSVQSELIIIDDISSSLDINTSNKLWDSLFLDKEKTFLIVSTRREELMRADNIILLKDCHIEAEGPLCKLLEHCKEMQLLWNEKTN